MHEFYLEHLRTCYETATLKPLKTTQNVALSIVKKMFLWTYAPFCKFGPDQIDSLSFVSKTQLLKAFFVYRAHKKKKLVDARDRFHQESIVLTTLHTDRGDIVKSEMSKYCCLVCV